MNNLSKAVQGDTNTPYIAQVYPGDTNTPVNMAYYKTWPDLICMAWPQSWPGFNFGSKVGPKHIFGLASKVGLVSILASKDMFGLKFKNIFFPFKL